MIIFRFLVFFLWKHILTVVKNNWIKKKKQNPRKTSSTCVKNGVAFSNIFFLGFAFVNINKIALFLIAKQLRRGLFKVQPKFDWTKNQSEIWKALLIITVKLSIDVLHSYLIILVLRFLINKHNFHFKHLTILKCAIVTP